MAEKKEEEKVLNIKLPKELHKKVKSMALQEDKTLQDLVIETLQKLVGG